MNPNQPLFPGAPVNPNQNNQQNQGQNQQKPQNSQPSPVSAPSQQNNQPKPTQPVATPIQQQKPVQATQKPVNSMKASKNGGNGNTWIWILVGVLVVAAIVLLAIFLPKRGTAPTDSNGNGNGVGVTETVPGPFQTELKYGMEGSPEIALLQTFLIGQKYLNGAPNGDFYTFTQDAVKKFQQVQGLAVTGEVNAATRDLLNRFYAVAPGYFTDDESLAGIGTGQCKAFVTTSPGAGSKVSFPLRVTGIVHPKYNTGRWTVFEANAGSVVVKDAAGNALTSAVPLSLSGEWMNTDPKPFSVTIPALTANVAKDMLVDIVFTDDNPAGDEGTQHTCVLTVKI